MRAGICTPITKKFTFHTNVGWMSRVGVRGVVIGRHILFAEPASLIPNWLFRHELEHSYQQMIDGRVRFYLKYFWWSLRYGYKDNPYEVAARINSSNRLTQNEEEILWKLKDDSIKLPSA